MIKNKKHKSLDCPLRFGIDLGGTKIELAAFDAAGNERLRRRVATPRDDYLATLAAIREPVIDSERDLGARGSVGIGTPGSLSRVTGRLRNSCLPQRPDDRGGPRNVA